MSRFLRFGRTVRISGIEVLGAPLRRRDWRLGSWERTERRIVAGTPAHLYYHARLEGSFIRFVVRDYFFNMKIFIHANRDGSEEQNPRWREGKGEKESRTYNMDVVVKDH